MTLEDPTSPPGALEIIEAVARAERWARGVSGLGGLPLGQSRNHGFDIGQALTLDPLFFWRASPSCGVLNYPESWAIHT